MAKTKRNGCSVWVTRDDFCKPYQTVTAIDDVLKIVLFPGDGEAGFGFHVSRKDARLLARRINECLDAT